jgi:hypothetical protein
MSFSSRERYIQFPAISSESHGPRLTTERLLDVGPYLTAALYYGIVRVDARAGIRTTVNITRAEHDFREALHPAAFTGRLGADNVLHRIARWTSDDASATVCLNRSDEDSQL